MVKKLVLRCVHAIACLRTLNEKGHILEKEQADTLVKPKKKPT